MPLVDPRLGADLLLEAARVIKEWEESDGDADSVMQTKNPPTPRNMSPTPQGSGPNLEERLLAVGQSVTPQMLDLSTEEDVKKMHEAERKGQYMLAKYWGHTVSLKKIYLQPGELHERIVQRTKEEGHFPPVLSNGIPTENDWSDYSMTYMIHWIECQLRGEVYEFALHGFLRPRYHKMLFRCIWNTVGNPIEYTKGYIVKTLEDANQEVCAGCGKDEKEVSLTLEACGCRRLRICSPQCREDVWPIHRGTCQIYVSAQSGSQANPTLGDPANQPSSSSTDPPSYGKIDLNLNFTFPTTPAKVEEPEDDATKALTWFMASKQSDIYDILIDAYRLRADDEFLYEKTKRGIYAGGPDHKPIDDFRDFLARAKIMGIVPSWWNYSKQLECEKRAQGTGWHQLLVKIDGVDTEEYYEDYQDGKVAVRHLRVLAEMVYRRMVVRPADKPSKPPFAYRLMVDKCREFTEELANPLWTDQEEREMRMAFIPKLWESVRVKLIEEKEERKVPKAAAGSEGSSDTLGREQES